MRSLTLLPYYVRWHYGQALRGVAAISGNIVWFLWHFFSIALLSRTLLAPWQRLHEEHQPGFDIGATFSRLIVNVIMRVVGAVVRLAFIITGLAAIGFTVAAGFFVFLAWLVLPLVIIFCFIFGVVLLVRSV